MKLFCLTLALLFNGLIYAQHKVYRDFKEACTSPLEVVHLEIKHYRIDSLAFLNEMTNLESLTLMDCGLTVFPEKLNLPHLKKLDLSHNPFLHLNELLTAIQALSITHLNLSYCGIYNIPYGFNELKYISNVDLSHNYLSSIPRAIASNLTLLNLDLSENNLTSIQFLAKFNSPIQYLSIANNPIKGIGRQLNNLKKWNQLKSIDIRGINYELDSIPLNKQITELHLNNDKYNIKDLDAFPLLQHLSIQFPQSVSSQYIQSLNKLEHLVTLDINASNSVFPLRNLKCKVKEIHISSKGKQALLFNETLGTSVQSLTLNNKEITSILNLLHRLPNLTFLDIKNTSINGEEIKEILIRYPNIHLVYNFAKYGPHMLIDGLLNIRKIKAPFKNLDIEQEEFLISGNTSNIVRTKDGVKFKIPKGAFLLPDGKKYTGKVKIKTRSFLNAVDIFLSGIPMGIMQGNEAMALESGGMIEFRAFTSEGETLIANQKSPINVKIPSNGTSQNMNLYQLDEATGNWIEKGRDSVALPPTTLPSFNYFGNSFFNSPLPFPENPVSSFGPKNSFKIYSYNKKRNEFEMQFNQSTRRRFYTTRNLENLKRPRKSNVAMFRSFGNKYTIKCYNGKNEYDYFNERVKELKSRGENFSDIICTIDSISDGLILHFCTELDTIRLNATPKFYSDKLMNQQKRYYRSNIKYQRYLPRTEKENEEINKKYEFELVAYEIRLSNYYARLKFMNSKLEAFNKNKEIIENREESGKLGSEVIRSFAMDGFGVWNCDQIKRLSHPIEKVFVFVDDKKDTLYTNQINLICDDEKGSYSYNRSNITFSKRAKNAFICVLHNGMLGIITYQMFKSLDLDQSIIQIEPIQIDPNKSNSTEIRTLIGF